MTMIPYIERFREDNKPKVVVYGCGRSGTLFMQYYLKAFGLEVGHEEFFEDGISSWYIVEHSRSEIVKRTVENCNTVFIHLVRHPMKVISSMYRVENLCNRSGLDFVRRGFDTVFKDLEPFDNGTFLFTAKWWCYWNKLCVKNFGEQYRVKVEDLLSTWQILEIADRLNVKANVEDIKCLPNNIHTAMNLRDKRFIPKKLRNDFIIEDIFREDKETAREIIELAIEYGYEV